MLRSTSSSCRVGPGDPDNPHDLLTKQLCFGMDLLGQTDPAQSLTAARKELDDLGHDLSVDDLSVQGVFRVRC